MNEEQADEILEHLKDIKNDLPPDSSSEIDAIKSEVDDIKKIVLRLEKAVEHIRSMVNELP